MLTNSMKRIAFGLALAAVVFTGRYALATEADVTMSNPNPRHSDSSNYGEMDSTQLLDQLDRAGR